jgi:hypothetical protein
MLTDLDDRRPDRRVGCERLLANNRGESLRRRPRIRLGLVSAGAPGWAPAEALAVVRRDSM